MFVAVVLSAYKAVYIKNSTETSTRWHTDCFVIQNKLLMSPHWTAVLIIPVENFLSNDSGPQDGKTPGYLSPAGPKKTVT